MERKLLGELGWLEKGPTVLVEDKSGAIKRDKSEKHTKHVDIRYHFIWDIVDHGAKDL